MTTCSVITGGAGFIGSNLAQRLLAAGERVILLDNLSRANVQQNVAWLRDLFGHRAELWLGDVRDAESVREAVRCADHVFHLAAQVAVTSSLAQPVLDFDVNARGTLHVLEAMRERRQPPTLVYTSTNKVYGALERLELQATSRGYEPRDQRLAACGVDEETPIDFVSPYGCSKGCADQYVLDYARCYGLRGVVFRMSCIYGPRQFGTEDQGWVANFMRRAMCDEAITIYGDGLQTRDVLFVGDLVDAFLRARARIDVCAGRAFNIGGGPEHTVHLLEALRRIGTIVGRDLAPVFERERKGDQRYYVSDIRRFASLTGWRPCVGLDEGLERLGGWLADSWSGKDASERARSHSEAALGVAAGVLSMGAGR